MNDLRKLTGYQLRAARYLLNMTQIELSKELGTCGKNVGDFERGKSKQQRIYELAIKFLLVQRGLYAHFRVMYLCKNENRRSKIDVLSSTWKKDRARPLVIRDALNVNFKR